MLLLRGGTRFSMSSAYRQPKPTRKNTITQARFYLANESGGRISSYGQQLLLAQDYLWIDESLTIPLASITAMGLTKKGGFIRYWDGVSGCTLEFYFMRPGFLRSRIDVVEAFLGKIDAQRFRQIESGHELDTTLAAQSMSTISKCECCESNETQVFVFRTFRFVGIAPLAYSYSLISDRFVLCRDHAPREAFRVNVRNAAFGNLGFPGFLAAPWYNSRNLYELRRRGTLSFGDLLQSICLTILLPLGLVAAVLFQFVKWTKTLE